jgi:hypothetical protein
MMRWTARLVKSAPIFRVADDCPEARLFTAAPEWVAAFLIRGYEGSVLSAGIGHGLVHLPEEPEFAFATEAVFRPGRCG